MTKKIKKTAATKSKQGDHKENNNQKIPRSFHFIQLADKDRIEELEKHIQQVEQDRIADKSDI